ncbi:YihY family inner membrane protein [Burkholderiaceae bacterium FT117]|uniref:YihY family inner membrane protein n=1 Tax=Zeimonas sediminis TaxID=2944268 RepID=UPI002342D4E9|nr:YihY family inner membrane protein [Zeimonas sediminis]MCM5571952.1 YihY family inner membrane protein [Zeimonas sediminis]
MKVAPSPHDSSPSAAALPFGRALASLARAMIEQARELRLSQVAGSLAFLSMLAIVPMFSIGFAVMTALPVFGELREALHRFLDGNLFPAAFSQTLLSHVGQFAAKAGELSALGAIVFFLTAFSALLTVEATLNRIWRADRRRPLTLRLTLYWAVLTLGPLLLATSLLFHGVVVTRWLRGGELQELRGVWFALVPWLTSLAGLTLLYRLVPATFVRWSEAFAGALLASLLFELLRRGVGLYVVRFPTYTVVYGAFAALPLFLLWLLLGWMALLAGALLAANLRWWGQPDDTQVRRTMADRFDDARRVLDTMVAEAGERTDATIPARSFEGLFDRDPRRAADAVGLLAALGYLTRFVTLADLAPVEAQVSTGRLRLLLRRLARRAPLPIDDDEGDPIWAERWGWAAAPATLSLRPLFDAVWLPSGGDSRDAFPAAFLDAPLWPACAAARTG